MKQIIDIYIIIKRKDKIKSLNINKKLNSSEINLIYYSLTNFNEEEYNKSNFIELTKHSNSNISLNKEKEYFNIDFLNSIENLKNKYFLNIDIFENYILFFFQKNDNNYIAFKKFENYLKIKKKSDAFFLAWPINDDIKITYKNASDISIPLDWDFCLSFEDITNCYINNLNPLSDFFNLPIEDQKIINFNKFEMLIEKNGFKFKTEKDSNDKIKTNSYLRGLPSFRHKDIENIITDSTFLISPKQEQILLKLGLINSKKEIFITKIKDLIAFLVEKMYSHNKKDWYIADKHTKYQK